MDKDEIIASRESGRISAFLTAMVEAGKIPEFERQLVDEEWESVARSAGWRDAKGEWTGEDDLLAPVTRHTNLLRKQKIIELHPELEDELQQFLDYRPYHPIPPAPAALAQRGVALREYRSFLEFLDSKRDQGLLTRDEVYAVTAPMFTVFRDSTIDVDSLDDNSDRATIAEALRLMRQKLLELRPEFASEIERLGPPRSRRSR